ncbi:MAG TPA: 30S ribosomal protein S1 [Candidatus Xenobia bacterium]|jgi:small subunit ribosomal protein S1
MDNLETPREATATHEPTATPPTEKTGTEENHDLSMADAFAQSLVSFQPGQFLQGRVVKVDREGVMVDVGYKSEGFIRPGDLSHRPYTDPLEVVKPGDEIDVVVVRVSEPEGELFLSKKRADTEASWKKVITAHEQGTTLMGTAIEQVKGGLIVDLGLRGFLPASQVDLRPVKDLGDYVGEALSLKVIEIDRGRRKVVLSRKKALEEERSNLKTSTMLELIEGQIVTGTVARLTNFGAFVNLGGVDGLVHLSELSWKRIKHPSEVVRIGERVDVLVLKVDRKRDRISLSLRQARPDPWLAITDSFKEGQLVKGKVSKLAKNYVFVELMDGVEGLIPLAELSEQRNVKPEDVLKVDEEIEVKILEIRSQERRILLSLRQARADADASEYRKFISPSGGTFTVGALLRSKMQEQGLTGSPAAAIHAATSAAAQPPPPAPAAQTPPTAPPPAPAPAPAPAPTPAEGAEGATQEMHS